MHLLLVLLAAVSPAMAQSKEYRSVEEVMAAFSNEPTVQQVQAMALEYSKTDPRYVDAWLRASKNAAWLPELTAEYDWGRGTDADYDYVVTDPSADPEIQQDSSGVGVDIDVKVRAKWQLDELVMSSNRIRTISEAQDVVKLRDKVLEEVTRLYFERRRLQVDLLLNPGGDLKARTKNEMRLQELTALLDAYTGGRFSSAITNQ